MSHSDQRYRHLCESLRDGWVSADLDGVMQECNPAFERLTGYRAEELVQMTLSELTPERWHATDEEIIATQVMARGYTDVYEKEVIRKDGTVVPIEIRMYLERDAEDRPAGIWALARDMGDRRLSEQELLESEARYRAILEGIQDGYYEVDLRGNFLLLNDAMADFLGYGRSELIGVNNRAYMDKANARKVFAAFNRVFVSRCPSKGIDYELIRKDGDMRIAEISISLIEAPDGTPIGFRGVARDVTERRWSEVVEGFHAAVADAVATTTSLRELIATIRTLLGKLIDTTNFYVALYDTSTDRYSFPFHEDQYDDLETFELQRLPGSLTDYVRRTGQPILIDRAVERKLAAAGEISGVVGTDSPIWLGAPLVTDKGTIGVVAVQSYDNPKTYARKDVELLTRAAAHISVAVERKQAEEERRLLEDQLRQAQRLEGLGVLAGGIAHDFNNLLQAMAGIPHVMRGGSDQPDRIEAAAAELETLIKVGAKQARQLLLFSRKEPLSLCPLDLSTVISESLVFLRRLLRENIKLTLQLAGKLPQVRADAGQLEQVLMNLMVNASDAMPLGGTLLIRTESDGRCVHLVIEDSGCGIPPELAEKVFEPFFSTKEPAERSGLGLSVVHSIVNQHGGSVSFRNRPGGGTVFRVSLPCVEEETTGQAEAANGDAANGAGEQALGRILLVEDDDGVRNSLTEIVALLGHDVTAARSGEEAVNLAVGETFDVLLTDYLLPGISGLDLVGLFRAHSPEIPVIILTGYAEDDALQRIVLETGITLLRKPCTVERLASTLTRVLRRGTAAHSPE